jgi:hypothetical protein
MDGQRFLWNKAHGVEPFVRSLQSISWLVETKARQRITSWPRWLTFTSSHLIYLRSTLILSCHLCLGHPSGLILSGFPFLIFPKCAICPANPIVHEFVNLNTYDVENKLWSSFAHYVPVILLMACFLRCKNYKHPCSSENGLEQVEDWDC